MASVDAFIAANRFGLGPRPGELNAIDRDVRGWLRKQITNSPSLPHGVQDLPTSAEMLKRSHEERLKGPEANRAFSRDVVKGLYIREVAARTRTQARSLQPFRERLVSFWSNHFTVSGTRFTVSQLAGGYEREAIRPNIFGNFSDLLTVVVRHPAMLSYLDNARSIGPNSVIGRRRKAGLNENLAREILELHTLGVNGGYRQSDVTEFAKMLTGWSHGGIRTKRSIDLLGPIHGTFEFHDRAHEPGSKTLLGKTYQENGEQEAIAALKDIARHHSTARHIATKLARHFIADTPSESAVDKLAAVFLASDGDLAQVYQTLIDLDEVWAEPLPKIKSPYELVVSTMRALAISDIEDRKIVGSLNQLGQMVWRAPSPQGWPDLAKHWMSPESLMRRIEWTRQVASQIALYRQPAEIASEIVGPALSPLTREALDAAPSGPEAIALLLASPEFQRR